LPALRTRDYSPQRRLKPSDFLRPDDDFILTEFAFEPFTQRAPESVFNIVRHDFDHSDAVTLCFAAALPQPLGRTSDKTGRAAKRRSQFFQEAIKPLLSDRLSASGSLLAGVSERGTPPGSS
jgi:hypothetical protein